MRLLVSCRQYFWYVHKPLFDAVLSVGATSAVVEFSVAADRVVLVSLDLDLRISLASVVIVRAADECMQRFKSRHNLSVLGMRIVIRPLQKRVAYFAQSGSLHWERVWRLPSGVRHEA